MPINGIGIGSITILSQFPFPLIMIVITMITTENTLRKHDTVTISVKTARILHKLLRTHLKEYVGTEEMYFAHDEVQNAILNTYKE